MATDVKPRRAYRTELRQQQTELTKQRILDAARRLLLKGGYGQVTMHELAREAGVAYQTVFSRFGNKVQVAMELCETGFPHVSEALAFLTQVEAGGDPVALLGAVGSFARRLHAPCADLMRFMRESGDPRLLARFNEIEGKRRERLADLGPQLERAGRLRPGLSASHASDFVWVMAGPENYQRLVLDSGWTPDRFERWLGEALVRALVPDA